MEGEPNDEDDDLRVISLLRSAKKEIFEIMKTFSDELEKIAQREQECADRRHRLRTEKHERERHQQTVQRVIELDAELKQVKCENVKLSDTNRNLKQSLDQAVKFSKVQKQKITELENMANVPGQSRSETGDSVAVVKLQKQLGHTTELLSRTKGELNEMRQRLSDVQERLTVAEQVTAATQQRVLQESDNSEQPELAQHEPTTPTGFSWQIQMPEINTDEKCRNNIGLHTHIVSRPLYVIRLLFVACKRKQHSLLKFHETNHNVYMHSRVWCSPCTVLGVEGNAERTYRGCQHVSTKRADTQRAAENSVSERSSSRSR